MTTTDLIVWSKNRSIMANSFKRLMEEKYEPLWSMVSSENGMSNFELIEQRLEQQEQTQRFSGDIADQQTAYKELSDAEVVRLYLQTQRSDYFIILYRRYAPKVFGKCLPILKSYDEAEDVVQDVFVKTMMNLPNFGERLQFSTWIYSITYNCCIDVIRKTKKETRLFTDDIERAPDVIAEEVSDEFLLGMDEKYLKNVLEMLPAGDQMIFLMKYQDDMSIRDISEVLNKTESAVKMKIKRAKHKAQELFYKMFNRD